MAQLGNPAEPAHWAPLSLLARAPLISSLPNPLGQDLPHTREAATLVGPMDPGFPGGRLPKSDSDAAFFVRLLVWIRLVPIRGARGCLD